MIKYVMATFECDCENCNTTYSLPINVKLFSDVGDPLGPEDLLKYCVSGTLLESGWRSTTEGRQFCASCAARLAKEWGISL